MGLEADWSIVLLLLEGSGQWWQDQEVGYQRRLEAVLGSVGMHSLPPVQGTADSSNYSTLDCI